MSKIAVVLIRGLVGVRVDIKDTLFSLNLRKKHACAIVEDTPSVRGMLKKSQDYTTFGTISDEVLKELETKRKANENGVYFLAPPVGGFERKGIKKSFIVGGALGDRKEDINVLLKKMM
jgi:large subunit ribosomal protein L30